MSRANEILGMFEAKKEVLLSITDPVSNDVSVRFPKDMEKDVRDWLKSKKLNDAGLGRGGIQFTSSARAMELAKHLKKLDSSIKIIDNM